MDAALPRKMKMSKSFMLTSEEGVIETPGKYEGEMWWTPTLWGLVLNDVFDTVLNLEQEETPTEFILVTDDEELMGQLGYECPLKCETGCPGLSDDTYAFLIGEDSQGFVRTEELTRSQYDNLTKEEQNEC